MFCENCGIKLPDNSSFCEECGHKVSFMENETNVNEENLNMNKKSGSKLQRGPIPPVMRTTTPQQPPLSYEGEMSDRFEYNKTNCHNADIISFGQYVGMIFLSGIPIINIILFVKWGFFNKQKPNKSNFAKALLFYYLIAVIIYALYIRLWLSVTSGI